MENDKNVTFFHTAHCLPCLRKSRLISRHLINKFIYVYHSICVHCSCINLKILYTWWPFWHTLYDGRWRRVYVVLRICSVNCKDLRLNANCEWNSMHKMHYMWIWVNEYIVKWVILMLLKLFCSRSIHVCDKHPNQIW